jgi:hypothetical protein
MNIAEITTDQVERVYSGRQGCMCGCLGTYSSNPRQVKRVLSILKNDPRAEMQDGYILHRGYQRDERNYVVFLKRPAPETKS